MPSLLLKFLFENYVLVLLCFVTTPVESLLYLALLRVPQVPQGANPGTQHLLSCTPGTPGSQEQYHRLIHVLISSPPGTPGTPDISDLSNPLPLSTLGTPGTPGNPDESHISIQVPISYPQVPQVPQVPQMNPNSQGSPISSPPGTPGTPGTPDYSHRSIQSLIPHLPPPRTPGTLGTPEKSLCLIQFSISPSTWGTWGMGRGRELGGWIYGVSGVPGRGGYLGEGAREPCWWGRISGVLGVPGAETPYCPPPF